MKLFWMQDEKQKMSQFTSLFFNFANEDNYSEHWSGTSVLIQNVIKIICWNLCTSKYFKFSNKNLKDDICNEIITLYSDDYILLDTEYI